MLILELLTLITLTFSVLIVLFEVSQIRAVILLIYVLLVFSFFIWRKLEGKWAAIAMGLLFLLPYFTRMTQEYAFFTVIYTVVFTLYYHRKLGTLYPEDLSLRFKITYGLLVIVALVGIGNESFRQIVLTALPFMLLYFFSTIIFSTSLRHRKAGLDQKKNRRYIMLYLALTSLFSLVASISELRDFFSYGAGVVSNLFLDIFFFVIYPFVYALFYVYSRVLAFLRNLPEEQNPETPPQGGGFMEEVQESAGALRDTPLINTLLPILFVLIIVFFIVRLIRGRKRHVDSELPFEEVREFIVDERTPARRVRKEKLPSDYKEQIRYYYRRYLREISAKVRIEKSDTSLIIKEKGASINAHSEEIREMYTKLRYTDMKAEEQAVAKFRKYIEEKTEM